MGVIKPNFSAPVCNSFQAKIREDQLCYTVDPNIYRVDKPLELTLLLDYNEEREISLYEDNEENKHENHLSLSVKEAEKRYVIIETIGKDNRLKCLQLLSTNKAYIEICTSNGTLMPQDFRPVLCSLCSINNADSIAGSF